MTDPLAGARALSRLLDNAVRVPGTGVRVGLDPVLGLVPGLGDVAGAALSGYIVLLAARHGVSHAVIVRMVANVAIDTAVGTVPVLGDLFDVGWKANSRNLALLDRAREQPASTQRASALVVGGALAALALLAGASIAVAVLAVRALLALSS